MATVGTNFLNVVLYHKIVVQYITLNLIHLAYNGNLKKWETKVCKGKVVRVFYLTSKSIYLNKVKMMDSSNGCKGS